MLWPKVVLLWPNSLLVRTQSGCDQAKCVIKGSTSPWIWSQSSVFRVFWYQKGSKVHQFNSLGKSSKRIKSEREKKCASNTTVTPYKRMSLNMYMNIFKGINFPNHRWIALAFTNQSHDCQWGELSFSKNYQKFLHLLWVTLWPNNLQSHIRICSTSFLITEFRGTFWYNLISSADSNPIHCQRNKKGSLFKYKLHWYLTDKFYQVSMSH